MNVTIDAAVQAHLKKLTVLLVEDDELTREMGAQFLSRYVGVLITANNGAEGLAAFQKQSPDIVITDIQMPVMDGLAMIREIRSGNNHKPVPILVMTAFDQLDYLKHSINLGVYEYVLKPLNVSTFIESLEKCTRHLLSENSYLQTQDDLVVSRNMYAELFDFAPIAYFIFDPRGVIQEANNIGEHLLGIEKKQLSNTPFSNFVANSDDRKSFSLHLENVLRCEGMQRCVIRLTGAGGTEIYGQLQSVAVGAGTGGNIRILSSIVDGTDSEQLKKEVQGALEYAENIVETVREPLVVLNSDLKILTANHSFYDTFKVLPEETVGNFIYDVGNRQWDIPALRVLFEEILPHDTVFNGYEVEHDFPGIGRKTILLNAREVFRENNDSRIILLAMEDITERKLTEKIREDIERITRHDLKTPLNPIINFPELLLMDTNLTPDQIESIQLIRSSGYRMLNIIDSSLSLYKMEQGTYRITPVRFDLFQSITCIERESAHEFAKKRLKLVRFLGGKAVAGGDVFMLNSEELLCYTMLSNLIKNAIEASAPDGVITVSCEEDALWNFIGIHNSGAVPEKVRTGFFDKYVTHGKKTGTGLGTYSALLAARTQKGDISMTTSEEAGTLITVRLPKNGSSRTTEQLSN